MRKKSAILVPIVTPLLLIILLVYSLRALILMPTGPCLFMPAGPLSYAYGPLSFMPTGPLIDIDLHCYNVALFLEL